MRLEVRLLGLFDAMLGRQSLVGLPTAKSRGLLAYLMVEMAQPHARETLAAMLWPDTAMPAALGNLRSELSHIHQALAASANEPPFLLVNRESIRFNPASSYWLDLRAFEQHVALGLNSTSTAGLSQHAIEHLQTAISLCRGRFLEGVRVKSGSFEEWMLVHRERIHRLVIDTLDHLTMAFEARHEFDVALEYARRQLELEPWREEAHQHIMRLLALSGQRSAALAQYGACRRALKRDLAVQPTLETWQLYVQIRDGTLEHPHPWIPAVPSDASPADNPDGPPPHQPAPFVGRTAELAWLGRSFDAACAGRGTVVFVTGEAGCGKTALLQEFSRTVVRQHSQVLVTAGNCDEQTHSSPSYLAVREILQQLVGGVTVDAACGMLIPEHVRRLSAASLTVAQVLIETAPELMGMMVPAELLRAHRLEPSLGSHEPAWHAPSADRPDDDGADVARALLHQAQLFESATRVLQTISLRQPLVVLLDNLHRADTGTIQLLFHLGQRLHGSHILVVGIYRPLAAQSSLLAQGERHPLETVVNELRRNASGIELDLDQLDGHSFVEAWLAAEPNRLSRQFRERLFRYTNGNPLFTVDLMRAMQVSGDLLRDAQGRWTEGPCLSWNRRSARIEAAVAERLAYLSPELRTVLTIASIEGPEFTAEVIAHVQDRPTADIVHQVSEDLCRRHRLVIADGIWTVDGQHLARYRFRHALVQEYLYHSLDAIERAYLHQAIEQAIQPGLPALLPGRLADGAAQG